jgi:hypothetical protein
MELKRVAGGNEQCTDGYNCPTINLAGAGDLVVTGPAVPGLDLPAGEGAVRIPAMVLLAAADRLRQEVQA